MPVARLTSGLGPVAAGALAAWAFFAPPSGSWAFAGVEFAFLAWLARQVRSVSGAALVAGAREPLDADEEDLVRRYPFYFSQPALARECASTLAAVGLISLLLVPWLTYKLEFPQAAAGIGVFLFAVAKLTKLLSPVYSLRMATAKGDREALRLLSAHDGAARKLAT